MQKIFCAKEEHLETGIRHIPPLAEDKNSCCGCTACTFICPVKAISMSADVEGFLYPNIDGDKCIRCWKCINSCSFKQLQKEKRQ